MTFGHNGVHILITPMTNESNILSNPSRESWHESECIPLLVSRSLNLKNKQGYELGQGPCVSTGNMRMFYKSPTSPTWGWGGEEEFHSLVFLEQDEGKVCVCVCVCVRTCACVCIPSPCSEILQLRPFQWPFIKKLNLTNYQYLVPSTAKATT